MKFDNAYKSQEQGFRKILIFIDITDPITYSLVENWLIHEKSLRVSWNFWNSPSLAESQDDWSWEQKCLYETFFR